MRQARKRHAQVEAVGIKGLVPEGVHNVDPIHFRSRGTSNTSVPGGSEVLSTLG